jgi:MoaA/NifB/PqqE/SkfB family radical SAM enzyme
MKAKIGDHYATRRKPLYKIVPLDTPLSVSIEPTTYCNLKCNFCIHSLHKNEILKSGHVFGQMNADTFDLIVSQLEDFPRPVKSFAFIGNGEPLLHRELPSMIEKIKGNRLAENVIIVTNGILLTHELSKNLLSAGVDTIKISYNGLSAADYKKIAERSLTGINFFLKFFSV